MSSHSRDGSVVRAVLCAALYPNVIRVWNPEVRRPLIVCLACCIECGRCVGTLSGGTRGRGAATASRGRAQTADQGRRYGAGLPHCLLSQNFCVSSCCPRKFANLLIHYEQGACMCTHRLRMRAWASTTVRGSCTTKLQRLRVCLCATGTVCFPIVNAHLCHIVHFHLLFLFVFAY